jgi:hypothetical protein
MERVAATAVIASLAMLLGIDAIAAAVKVAELTGSVKHKGGDIPIRAQMQLDSGAWIVGASADASVLLECVNGATQMLSGQFDALIVGDGDGKPCAIDLKRGTAVATTPPEKDGSTGASIKIGDVTLGSKSTQFGASLADGPTSLECFVIEGEVTLGGWHNIATLNTAQRVRRGVDAPDELSIERYDELAHVYAKLTLSSKNASAPAIKELSDVYLRSFRNPADTNARTALVARQKQLTPDSALYRYQAGRATTLEASFNASTTQTGGVPGVDVGGRVGAQAGARVQLSAGPPRYKNHRVDVCRIWGDQCGQPAADAWCRSTGKTRARSYKIEEDIGASQPTIVIGTGQLCTAQYCDAFSRIVCE